MTASSYTISQIRAVPLYCEPGRLESVLDYIAGIDKAIESALRMRLHNPCKGIRYTRNGGIRFLRIGRLQFSFCICKKG